MTSHMQILPPNLTLKINANCKFYHGQIPKAAKMKKILSHENNTKVIDIFEYFS